MLPSYWLTIRRPLDFIGAAILFVLLLPILVFVSVIVRLDGGPILFLQPRVGRGEKVFYIYKFRSMIVDADDYLDESGMPTRERITPVGRLLRLTSIDELPQLINVLIGDMSLIGPRPILTSMLSHLTSEERKRFYIRPGITGLAQVVGRNTIPWSERFVLDLRYLETASPSLDFFILLQTAKRVLTSQGIVHDRNANEVDDVTNR